MHLAANPTSRANRWILQIRLTDLISRGQRSKYHLFCNVSENVFSIMLFDSPNVCKMWKLQICLLTYFAWVKGYMQFLIVRSYLTFMLEAVMYLLTLNYQGHKHCLLYTWNKKLLNPLFGMDIILYVYYLFSMSLCIL